jgi:hypothetical protein
MELFDRVIEMNDGRVVGIGAAGLQGTMLAGVA